MKVHIQKVAEMDARHYWRIRIATFVGTVVLIVTALWASDFKVGTIDLGRAWQDFRDWWYQEWHPAQRDERQAIAPQLPTPVTVDVRSKEPAKPLMGTDSSISKTPQALVLVATSRGRNAREGTASLGTSPENPQTYAAGALLANGARLLEIYDDHVVLERNGKQAKLYLATSGKKSDSDLLKVGGEPAIKPAVATHQEVLTDYIRPTPVYDGNMIHGYQVYAGQKSGVFSQLGLQNGDVILSLNGQPFVDPQQAIDLFNQLTTGMAMSATVERKGNVERLSLDGRVIAQDQERMREMTQNPSPIETMP